MIPHRSSNLKRKLSFEGWRKSSRIPQSLIHSFITQQSTHIVTLLWAPGDRGRNKIDKTFCTGHLLYRFDFINRYCLQSLCFYYHIYQHIFFKGGETFQLTVVWKQLGHLISNVPISPFFHIIFWHPYVDTTLASMA